MANKLLKEAERYFKNRFGFDADVKIKMDTVAVTKLMHDFAQHLFNNATIEIKTSKK